MVLRETARTVGALLLCLAASGCANIDSIWRRSWLPGDGRAVHLDAKQRVVFGKTGEVCAEPSPDALSAYAASFGGGVAAQQYGSLAVAQALTESAASIGLRTQSITLMRDALYRICEAYYNGAINDVMVMQLLGRSQDLTLAILAIEQITQPVAAQQAILTGSSSSASSASLLVNEQLLAAARTRESQANDDVTAKKAKRDETQKKVDTKKQEIQQLEGLNPPGDTTKQKAELKDLETQLQKDNEAVTAAETAAADAKRDREILEKNRDSAQASASAGAASGGALSAPIILKQPPSDQSLAAVADTVKEIVSTVVRQDHRIDACLALISAVTKERTMESVAARGQQIQPDALTLERTEARKMTQQSAMDVCNELLTRTAQALKTAPAIKPPERPAPAPQPGPSR